MQAHLWLYKYLQGWRVCLFVPTAIWLRCSDESKTGLFGSFQQHLWRLNFLLVANNPAHSTPFAVFDRFGILLDKSGFNPWACALMDLTDPDGPVCGCMVAMVRWGWGAAGSAFWGVAFYRGADCCVLVHDLTVWGPKISALRHWTVIRCLQGIWVCFFHSFVGFGEDTSAASCVDLRCIGRYDMIKSYDSQWYICTYLLTYLPTYLLTCLPTYLPT